MPAPIVLGLYASKGTAEDACKRLITEGIPEADISLRPLKEIGPIPQTMEAELDALTLDPFSLGYVGEAYAGFIRNGETAICVRANSQQEAEVAVSTLHQYAPIDVRIVSPQEQEQFLQKRRQTPSTSRAE